MDSTSENQQVAVSIASGFLEQISGMASPNAGERRPFFLYYNHSMMHLPNIPRDEFKGKSSYGDWADCLLEMDGDFGTMLDLLDELGTVRTSCELADLSQQVKWRFIGELYCLWQG
jgi:arylsulfatase A-like enzyme